MRVVPAVSIAISLAALRCAPLLAQTSAPAPYTYSDPLGFSYVVPAAWEVVDASASLSQEKEKATQSAASEGEKKGIACAQIGLTARRADPVSVILVETLPFNCFGQQMTENDLPGFGTGATEGLKQSLDIGDAQVSTYSLGAHRLWIERAPATPKGQPGKHFTVEIACTLLQKAAVCWMTLASDDAALAVFEHGAVTLEADQPTPLVPAGAFAASPSKP